MPPRRRPIARVIVLLVPAHALLTLLHGAVHERAAVGLSAAGSVFVLLVIVLGPLAGLALWFRWPATGAAVLTVTMAAALVFGLVNHVLLDGPDRIDRVPSAWRAEFAATAVLLAATEAAAAALGGIAWSRARSKP
jgi:hypothetical protein